MRQSYSSLYNSIDWLTVILYFILIVFGWINIYAAVFDVDINKGLFDFSVNSGKQLLWIGISILLIISIFVLDFELWEKEGYIIFGLVVVSLIFVLIFGKEIAGSKSWFQFGFIRIQPAEFAKFATALAIAKFLNRPNLRLTKLSSLFFLFSFIAIPVGLIIKQGDTGSALVFTTFIIVFYREGLPHLIMLLGVVLAMIFITTLFLRENYLIHLIIGIISLGIIGFFLIKKNLKNILALFGSVIIIVFLVLSVNFIVTVILKPHQQKRIESFISPEKDIRGAGWQVMQSKIAIGSGGVFGKGFLGGTQTKLDFVPDQSTDFIFCTVGEERGWLGSLVFIVLFITLILRIIVLAERQKTAFYRVYGYSVVAILFFHFVVNIGMTIGLIPVIGIPLPFFSYGGSSLLSFTILLFVFIKVDAHRSQVLEH